MRKLLAPLLLLCVITQTAELKAQASSESVYMFCYFKKNGEDGLHLAYSNDVNYFNPSNFTYS